MSLAFHKCAHTEENVQQVSQDQVRVVKAVPAARQEETFRNPSPAHSASSLSLGPTLGQLTGQQLRSSILEYLDSRGGVVRASSHGPHPQQASSCHQQRRDRPAATHRLRSSLLRDLHSAKARCLTMQQKEMSGESDLTKGDGFIQYLME